MKASLGRRGHLISICFVSLLISLALLNIPSARMFSQQPPDSTPKIGNMRFQDSEVSDPPPDETLYVDNFTAESTDWITHGTSPYLDAIEDDNYIEGTADGSWMAHFGFANITPGPDLVILRVVLEGYTNGSYNENVDYDVYTIDDVWLGSLYATGEPAWVTPRWINKTVDEVYSEVLSVEGLNNLQVKIVLYDPMGFGGVGNFLDALRLKIFTLKRICIRADGSIDPPTAPISSTDLITYTFTDNITGWSIVLEKDNIMIDGAGHTLQGFERAIGMDISGRSNITINNLNISAFQRCVLLSGSSSSSITGNNISNNDYGIYLHSSSYNNISGNEITTSGEQGIILADNSDYNTICENNIKENQGWDGIALTGSSHNSIYANNITDNDQNGIIIAQSSHNTLYANNITKNGKDGITLTGAQAKHNSVFGNLIAEHTAGIGIILQTGAELNTILRNYVTNNAYGILTLTASNNDIFHNNLVDNTNQVATHNSVNGWDDGYPSGGNYWSDYTGVDSDEDGIGDTPYVIDGTNQDNYPLMNPWTELMGDIDGDGDVDNDDLSVLAGAYGTPLGEPGYHARADFDHDGDVDCHDLFILAKNYGTSI